MASTAANCELFDLVIPGTHTVIVAVVVGSRGPAMDAIAFARAEPCRSEDRTCVWLTAWSPSFPRTNPKTNNFRNSGSCSTTGNRSRRMTTYWESVFTAMTHTMCTSRAARSGARSWCSAAPNVGDGKSRHAATIALSEQPGPVSAASASAIGPGPRCRSRESLKELTWKRQLLRA